MKRRIGIFIAFGMLVFLGLQGQDTGPAPEPVPNQDMEVQLTRIIEKNGESVYHAFFSLKELRPFSIIQFDRTADMYDNVFVTPKKFVSVLTPAELAELKSKIANYIMDFDVNKRAVILYKLGNWTSVDNQFTFIRTTHSISEIRLLESMAKVAETRNIFDSISKQGEFIIAKINQAERSEAYNNALNNVVSLTNNEQLNYYSKLYKELAIN